MIKLSKKQIIGLIAGFIIIAIIYYFFISDRESKESVSSIDNLTSSTSENEEDTSNSEKTNDGNKIKVYIAGEVQKPGVYELLENSRIADIIEQAGGTTEKANIDKINLAYILQDGMKVRIPNKKEKLESDIDETESYISSGDDESYISGGNNGYSSGSGFSYETSSSSSGSNSSVTTSSSISGISGKININTATQTELEQLPGIGPSTALKICNYRKESGKFKSIEDIKNVKGIGDAKYAKIKDLIRV